ncbi:hypothetical protein BH24ACI2_BH24ACI2_00700 [soil metagenome]
MIDSIENITIEFSPSHEIFSLIFEIDEPKD